MLLTNVQDGLAKASFSTGPHLETHLKERCLLACLLDVNFCSFSLDCSRPLVAIVGVGALLCSWRLGRGVIENPQRRLHTALCGRVASLPVGKVQAGALPAAQWLLCACSFQLLSIRLNGPIQGHSCASETLAARTQSAERALRARQNMPVLPASRNPQLFRGACGTGGSPQE